MLSDNALPVPATPLVYIPGVGHVSRRYATLREQLKSLVVKLGVSLDVASLRGVGLDWNIVSEDMGRVQILVSGFDKNELSRLKIRAANHAREIYPGVKMLNSKTRGYAIWNCYFSDGNFNCYACGFEFDMPLEMDVK